MDIDKVGKFIRKLRESKKWSQEELASNLYCDRTKINKLENGKRSPKIEELTLLSEIFDISLEELIAGEKKTEKNNKKIQSIFKEYLKQQNTKLKIMRLIIILLVSVLFFCFSVIAILYFFQNYKSIRVYRFSGSSENYEISDGLLIISKDKMYFKIDNIDPLTDNITIYSEINNERKLIYSGEPNVIINDNYGYESFISYSDFIKSNQNVYILIDDDEIKLNFKEDFVNNKIFYSKEKNVGENENTASTSSIPDKIKEYFNCDSEICHLDLEEKSLTYNNNIFTVMSDNIYFSYDVENGLLDYQNQNNSKLNVTITLKDNDMFCVSGNCDNMEKIYNDFYNNYILKYLE